MMGVVVSRRYPRLPSPSTSATVPHPAPPGFATTDEIPIAAYRTCPLQLYLD